MTKTQLCTKITSASLTLFTEFEKVNFNWNYCSAKHVGNCMVTLLDKFQIKNFFKNFRLKQKKVFNRIPLQIKKNSKRIPAERFCFISNCWKLKVKLKMFLWVHCWNYDCMTLDCSKLWLSKIINVGIVYVDYVWLFQNR